MPRARSLALVLALLASSAATDEIGTGFINKGTLQDSPVTIGATPEQVEILVRTATAPLERLTADLQTQTRDLAARLAVTEPAVRNMLRILGEQDVPSERLVQKLAEVAERHRELERRLAALESDDPVVNTLRERARAAVATGAYDEAERLLQEAEDNDLAAARVAKDLARAAQAAADDRLLSAAATRAERAELALARLDYRTAADRFAQAADLVPAGRDERRSEYRWRRAFALYTLGDEKGDNGALVESIAASRELLGTYTRERVPLAWATAQNNLGTALALLGGREAGTGRLGEAVEAFRAALLEHTRERAPLAWAMTQVNLGVALSALGRREAGTGRLEEAVGAFRAALDMFEQAGASHYVELARRNLALVSRLLAERRSGG